MRTSTLYPRTALCLGALGIAAGMEVMSGAAAPGAPPQTPQIERLNEVRFEIKAEGIDAEARTFEGLASTWEEDLGYDIVQRGAFVRTLDHWKSSGRVIYLIDSHASYDSVKRVVGKLIDARETDQGLWCKFEMVEAGDPDADAAWRRIKGGFITKLSIGYRAIKFEFFVPDGAEEWERRRRLSEVQLKEISLVVFPMNEGAQINPDSVKSIFDAVRAGTLTPEQKKQLRALLEEESPPPAPVEDDTPKGLAPEDPRRVSMEEALRNLTLHGLGTGA